MNNEQRRQQLDFYKAKLDNTEYLRQLAILKAEMFAKANQSDIQDAEPALDIANSNRTEFGKSASKKVLSTLFATVR